jgi:hypothetical protein
MRSYGGSPGAVRQELPVERDAEAVALRVGAAVDGELEVDRALTIPSPNSLRTSSWMVPPYTCTISCSRQTSGSEVSITSLPHRRKRQRRRRPRRAPAVRRASLLLGGQRVLAEQGCGGPLGAQLDALAGLQRDISPTTILRPRSRPPRTRSRRAGLVRGLNASSTTLSNGRSSSTSSS